MRNLLLFWYTLGFSYACANSVQPYYLSICSMITNYPEYRRHWNDTEEWIEYHRMMGVDHFFLYPHQCTEDFLEKLREYESEGVVTLVPLVAHEPRTGFPLLQKRAYNHCIQQYGHLTRWCAIMDDDEFILPKRHRSIPSFLKQYDKEKVNKIRIRWHCFGTSGWYHLPEDCLLTECLYRCINYKKNPVINGKRKDFHKEIVKPSRTINASNHNSKMKKGIALSISKDVMQLNHYILRDKFYATVIKHSRPTQSAKRKTASSVLHFYEAAEDRAIQKWVPALKKRLEERRK